MMILRRFRSRISIFALAALLLASAHVGEVFAEGMISPLTAAQNGLQQVGRMIAAGELNNDWSANLTAVNVQVRNIKGFAEYVVRITRSSGNPTEMSIYLNASGGYSGSSLEK